jgi:enolase-phosphatase E1
MSAIRAILTDIEGTTTPIAFVKDSLFPYARERMADFLQDHAEDPVVRGLLAEVAALRPGEAPLSVLLGWMDEDLKIGPLKILQGLIWDAGYRAGALRGELYPDVAPALRRWHADGITLAVYSSGSVAAQKLLFGCSNAGDLTPLLGGFFDVSVGPKRAAASYTSIAAQLGRAAGEILFLSDVAEELDAAAAAGLRTCQLLRAADGTVPSFRHAPAADFGAIAL